MRRGELFFEGAEEEVGVSSPARGKFVRRRRSGYDVLEGVCPDGVRYMTVIDDGLRDEGRLSDAVLGAIEGLVRAAGVSDARAILVAGLGNGSVDADSLGSLTVDRVAAGEKNGRRVFAIKTGVPEQTGIAASDLVCSTARLVSADLLLTVDSLAAVSPSRLCSAIQVSEGRSEPGSGAESGGEKIEPRRAGCPVVSVGVPTVVLGRLSRGGEEAEGLFTVCGVSNEAVFFASVISEAIGSLFG